jgi:transcription elongation GreA/GreB family factor
LNCKFTNPKRECLIFTLQMSLDFNHIKTEIFKVCTAFVLQKRTTLQNQISAYQLALTSETKSSAGDKHETGRAMLQLEIEKAGQQLKSVAAMQQVLSKINLSKKSNKIGLGSLVITDKATYFLAISLGAITINQKNYIVVSLQSPLGKDLFGKSVGQETQFNKAKILEIH